MITPLGIPLISFVGDFDELCWRTGRTSLRTIFSLQFAELLSGHDPGFTACVFDIPLSGRWITAAGDIESVED